MNRRFRALLAGLALPSIFAPASVAAPGAPVDAAAAAQNVTRLELLPFPALQATPLFAGPAGLAAARDRLAALERDGGWPAFAPEPPAPALRLGDAESPQIAELRSRLAASGDLRATPDNEIGRGTLSGFDSALDAAVRAFQRRHGLEADGVVGRATAAALAVPVTDRLRQIEVNLTRRLRLPSFLGERFVLVNLAGFELVVVDHGAVALGMNVVVGAPRSPSPELASAITHLALNPYWNVPASIARFELAPREAAEPGYLARRGIRVFGGPGGQAEVSAHTVDWEAFRRGELHLFLRQESGEANSLGRLAFHAPNPENVCLHDTPDRAAFATVRRAQSHGCIRLERPLDLAAFLLHEDPAWSADALKAAVGGGVQREIRLPEPVPVYLVYWTAWIDADGTLQFRDDIYGRDGL